MRNSGVRICQLLLARINREFCAFGKSVQAALEVEIAERHFHVLKSILNGDSYSLDHETTLDHSNVDDEFDDWEEQDIPSTESDYEERDENVSLFEDLPLGYMKQALAYYDAKNADDYRRHTWKTLQIQFPRIRHQPHSLSAVR